MPIAVEAAGARTRPGHCYIARSARWRSTTAPLPVAPLAETHAADAPTAAGAGAAAAAVVAAQQETKGRRRTHVPDQKMESGHYHVVLGEDLCAFAAGRGSPRYKVLDLLGQGTFSKVAEGWHRGKGTLAAVKIVRAIQRYTNDAKWELNFLHRMKEDDSSDAYQIVKYHTHFYTKSPAGLHLCIVFPRLGCSLLERLTHCGVFQLHQIAHVAWQMAAALNYMHARHHFIHTDIKPENVVIERPSESADGVAKTRRGTPAQWHPLTFPAYPDTTIRIIDFGAAYDAARDGAVSTRPFDGIVSTRQYRAPEVVLGAGWMYAADVWSMGCVLAELRTGRRLFATHDDAEHVALMQATLGPLPAPLLRAAPRAAAAAETDRALMVARVKAARPLRRAVGAELAGLLARCLDFDRSARIRAHDVMYHRFVTAHWFLAAERNAGREAHEAARYGGALGAAGSRTRVSDPPYRSCCRAGGVAARD